MSILGFLFLAFIAYLAFRLVFDFIIPIYRTTKRVRKSFREMHERMNGHTEHQEEKNNSKQNGNNNKGVGEYIDFEEIKDWCFPYFCAPLINSAGSLAQLVRASDS